MSVLYVLLGLVLFVGIGATFEMLKIACGTLLIALGLKKLFGEELPKRKRETKEWRPY